MEASSAGGEIWDAVRRSLKRPLLCSQIWDDRLIHGQTHTHTALGHGAGARLDVPGAGARLDEEGRRRLDQRGLAPRLRRHRGERAPPHPRLQAARHGGPGALRPRHGRRSRGWARRALRRCPRQGPTGRPHRHRDHRRGAPRCGGDAVRVARRDARRGVHRPHARTVYGTSRTATTSFFTHHLRLISLAAVIGAALPVAIWAKSRKSHLLSGAPLAGLLPVVM